MSTLFKPTKYNGCTKNQLWMSIISDSHDIHCGCEVPFSHLLDSIFPEGHSDRHKTIAEIIQRDTQACHSGGTEETSPGFTTIKEEDIKRDGEENQEEDLIEDAALQELIAAGEDAIGR